MVLVSLMLGALPASPADPPSDASPTSKRAEAEYLAARAHLDSEPTNAEAQWQFGLACFDWADCLTTNGGRAKIADQGIAACRRLVATDPDSAAGHYYLGMNLGQLARTKTLGALKLVDQMEKEFLVVLGLDAKFDHAGADRNLGLLYRDAPGWPTSIGSKIKARQHLARAARLSPEDPENLLNLIESELRWKERDAAARDLDALDELWPSAQKQFTSDQWTASWSDWTQRRADARKKASEPAKIEKAPRNSK